VNPKDQPDINDRDIRLVGERARVVEAFVGGRGRVFVSGSEWPAEIEGASPLAGESVIIESVSGPLLKVRAL
jgi:inner membrane protein